MDKRNGVCALKWDTMMDDKYWASAVDMWQEKQMFYSKPVIPLHTDIKASDYQHFGKKTLAIARMQCDNLA